MPIVNNYHVSDEEPTNSCLNLYQSALVWTISERDCEEEAYYHFCCIASAILPVSNVSIVEWILLFINYFYMQLVLVTSMLVSDTMAEQ